jgi:tRNA 2-thiocytidine biosynthesis protein TtcA
MVCLSGGKDSYGLLDVLLSLKTARRCRSTSSRSISTRSSRAFRRMCCPNTSPARGVPFHIAEQDTYRRGQAPRSRGRHDVLGVLAPAPRRAVSRRGELGATKIALGHHRDDLVATFFLNLFYGGKLKTMPPKLVSDDGKHVVIRPLAYVRERDLARYAQAMAFPLIPCTLCGSQDNLQRKQVAAMMREVGEAPSRPPRIDLPRARQRDGDAPARPAPARLLCGASDVSARAGRRSRVRRRSCR